MTLDTNERAALLDHAIYLFNAGVDTDAVLKVAQRLADWCEHNPVTHSGNAEGGSFVPNRISGYKERVA